jgi:predicted small secreted protein
MARISRLALLALACMAVLTACNTVKGFGKDVKKVGEQVEEKASK